MERALRQSLDISGGDLSIFVTRPIAAVTLGIAATLVLVSALRVAAGVRGQDPQL